MAEKRIVRGQKMANFLGLKIGFLCDLHFLHFCFDVESSFIGRLTPNITLFELPEPESSGIHSLVCV